MWHSVLQVGRQNEEFSQIRGCGKKFVAADFVKFAKENKSKYNLDEDEEGRLWVSTWFSDRLLEGYINTIIENHGEVPA